MLKNFLTLVFSLLLLQIVKAEKPDSLIVYYKNSGQRVSLKDSADYYRVILPPDTTGDKDLYRVYDYYSDGKLKSVGTSLTQQPNIVLDGTCIDYYRNGKRKRTAQYKNGRYTGTTYTYYPNGKTYSAIKVEDLNSSYYYGYYNNFFQELNNNYKIQILELRDSLDNLLVTNGTGHIIIFDDDFKKILEEGDISNNKKEGEWRGAIADSGKFICSFHKDALKSGISYMKSGHNYSFKQVETRSEFSDGTDAFYLFIKKNLQYPESARKRKVKGEVLVEFTVETNGTLSDVKVARGIMKSLDDEALRVINLSPLWVPAYRFGIPVRTHHTIAVSFYNL